MDRYVGSFVVSAYLSALMFLLAMLVVFDLLFEMDTYLKIAEERKDSLLELMWMLGRFYVLGIPLWFVTIAPFVTVIASMFAFSRLMAMNEIAPMVFTGRSLFRILCPMLGVGLLSALAMGATWQWVIPSVAEEYEGLRSLLKGDPPGQKRITLRAKDNPRSELFVGEYDRSKQLMKGVISYNRGSSRADGILITADSAQWNPQREDWELIRGFKKAGDDIVPQEYLGMSGVTPNLIVDSGKADKQTADLSYTDLIDLMQSRPGKNDYILAFHTHFTGEPPYVGTDGLVLAIRECGERAKKAQ